MQNAMSFTTQFLFRGDNIFFKTFAHNIDISKTNTFLPNKHHKKWYDNVFHTVNVIEKSHQLRFRSLFGYLLRKQISSPYFICGLKSFLRIWLNSLLALISFVISKKRGNSLIEKWIHPLYPIVARSLSTCFLLDFSFTDRNANS